MARTFRGEGVHKVDGKGRVSIPAAFRRVLESNDPDWTEGLNPSLVLVYGDARWNHIEGYHMAAMADLDARIAALPRGSRSRRLLEKLFSGQALPSQVDENGRIVLPQRLRDKIGLKGEALFIATGDTFQIWEPGRWAEREAEMADWLSGKPDDFDVLSLLDEAGGGL
ncbi:MAG: division/cell wall cluster transcriptional repressor MraZ [Rhodobacteraceae bacterium]|nr:division/cell wall cluster transcriptional repressor MraZ [Paracoccaceae bacterium]